jgi:hypothetical protein
MDAGALLRPGWQATLQCFLALINYFFVNQSPFPIKWAQFWCVVMKHAAAVGLPTHERFPHMLSTRMPHKLFSRLKLQ